MQIQTRATITGLKAVDFDQHKFIKLYVLVDVKNGEGQKTDTWRYDHLSDLEALKKCIGHECTITGTMKIDDKNQTAFLVSSIKPIEKKEQIAKAV